MTSKTVTTVVCDQCGEKISDMLHAQATMMTAPMPRWWQIAYAEERDGKWQADICSRRCLGLWIDGWREKPTLKVVE